MALADDSKQCIVTFTFGAAMLFLCSRRAISDAEIANSLNDILSLLCPLEYNYYSRGIVGYVTSLFGSISDSIISTPTTCVASVHEVILQPTCTSPIDVDRENSKQTVIFILEIVVSIFIHWTANEGDVIEETLVVNKYVSLHIAIYQCSL